MNIILEFAKTSNLLNDKNKLKPKGHQKIKAFMEKNEIFPFPDFSIAANIVIAIYHNGEIPKCECCKLPYTPDHSFKPYGYAKTCSTTCKFEQIRVKRKITYNAIDPITGTSIAKETAKKLSKILDYSAIGQKTKKTKRQNVNEIGQDIYHQTSIKTAITRFGRYVGVKNDTDFRKYRYQVEKYTRMQPIKILPNYEKRSHYYLSENPYHLDHKFSIAAGFELGIAPYIIGHISNLEMIPAQHNNKKGSACSISLDELFENYSKFLHEQMN